MRKNNCGYYIITAALLLIASAAALIGGVAWTITVSAVALVIWWSVYFARLRYSLIQDVIYVHSGLIFRRTREIPVGSILWVTRLELLPHRRAIASVLHTAGGWIVIFNDFSTKR